MVITENHDRLLSRFYFLELKDSPNLSCDTCVLIIVDHLRNYPKTEREIERQQNLVPLVYYGTIFS